MTHKILLNSLVFSCLGLGCSVGMDPFSPVIDGGNATLEPSQSLRFEVTPVTGVYTEASLFVVPTGEAPVEVLDVWVEGPDRDAFFVDSIALPIGIAPNQDAELTVGFMAEHTGSHGATVFVLLSDVAGEALSVKAEGMGCRDNDMDYQCDPN